MITHTTEWKSEEDTPPRPWFRFYDGGHKASEDDMEPFSAGQPESNREFSEKETFEEIGALEGRETEKAEATEEETEEEPVEWEQGMVPRALWKVPRIPATPSLLK